MKKLSVLLVCFALVAATACGGNTGENSSSAVSSEISYTPMDVSEYAPRGELPPLEIKLGDKADDVESLYSDDGDTALSVNEKEKYTELNAGEEIYYYLPDSDKTISAIVSFKDPYGYPLYEATEIEVKSFLGKPERDGVAYEDDVFFTFGTDITLYNVLVYTYGLNRLTFVFYDGTMMAATLINTEVWAMSH